MVTPSSNLFSSSSFRMANWRCRGMIRFLSLSRAAFPARKKILYWKKIHLIKKTNLIQEFQQSNIPEQQLEKGKLIKIIINMKMIFTHIYWCTITNSFGIRALFKITMLNNNWFISLTIINKKNLLLDQQEM